VAGPKGNNSAMGNPNERCGQEREGERRAVQVREDLNYAGRVPIINHLNYLSHRKVCKPDIAIGIEESPA
jgi:hypothetical protein